MSEEREKIIGIVLFEKENAEPSTIGDWLRGQPGLKLLASAENLSSIPDMCADLAPDVILIRLDTERLNEAQTVRLIRNQCPNCRVIVVGAGSAGNEASFDYLNRAIRDLTYGPASRGENFGYVL